MSYSLDLKRISITDYKEILKNKELWPARRTLYIDIDARFDVIMSTEINNVLKLQKALSTTKKIEVYAQRSGIPAAYLTLLRRELSSMVQKPVKLQDIPCFDTDILAMLESEGIKTTKHFYDYHCVAGDIQITAKRLGISIEAAKDTLSLSQLCRINGVGAVAAKIFAEAGYKTISDVADADAKSMLDDVTRINDARQYYKAKLVIKDMQFCIDYAKLLIRFDDA